jgi:hypothetical protein
VDDPLLVGVLDGLADRHEQLQPLARRQVLLVAEAGDGDAIDQLHDEERPPGVGGAGVEDAGDALVVHEGQGLAFGLEAGDHLGGVHTGLDDLEGDLAADGVLLLGHVDDAHAALADLLEQLVRPDPRARALRRPRRAGRVQGRSGCGVAGGAGHGGAVEESVRQLMGGQQGRHRGPQLGLPGTGCVQKGSALLGGLG